MMPRWTSRASRTQVILRPQRGVSRHRWCTPRATTRWPDALSPRGQRARPVSPRDARCAAARTSRSSHARARGDRQCARQGRRETRRAAAHRRMCSQPRAAARRARAKPSREPAPSKAAYQSCNSEGKYPMAQQASPPSSERHRTAGRGSGGRGLHGRRRPRVLRRVLERRRGAHLARFIAQGSARSLKARCRASPIRTTCRSSPARRPRCTASAATSSRPATRRGGDDERPRSTCAAATILAALRRRRRQGRRRSPPRTSCARCSARARHDERASASPPRSADQVTMEENGIDERAGARRHAGADVYTAPSSREFVLRRRRQADRARAARRHVPVAPPTTCSTSTRRATRRRNDFYAHDGPLFGELDALGADRRADGRPRHERQDATPTASPTSSICRTCSTRGSARTRRAVILPDHRSLRRAPRRARVVCDGLPARAGPRRGRSCERDRRASPGIELVLTREEACSSSSCRRTAMGDIVVVSRAATSCIGTRPSAPRPRRGSNGTAALARRHVRAARCR